MQDSTGDKQTVSIQPKSAIEQHDKLDYGSRIVITKRIKGICSGYFLTPNGKSEFKMDQKTFELFVGQWNAVAMGQK